MYDVTKEEHEEDEQKKIKPWRTFWDRGAVAEVHVDELFVRYHFSQDRAVPPMLREDSGQERRLMWLMASKAAVRMRMLRSPKSEKIRRFELATVDKIDDK